MTVCLADIVADLGGELLGDPGLSVRRLGALADADSGTLSFLANPRYAAQLRETAAGCVIVGPAHRDAAAARGAAIVADDPHLYFARVTRWWVARTGPGLAPGIHPGAFVDATARIAPDAHVGAGAVIEANAVVGAGAVVGALSVVGRSAVVGPGTRLAPRVSLLAGCRVGARSIVHSGAVIGADGFGFAPHDGRWEKIEQLGGVRIGDDVEIGANTCIDRGALDDTVIEDGAKIDNLVQIAHNVRIGAHTAIAGCVGIAGSTRIGAHCTIAGGVGIVGHITLADHVHVAANATVSRSILQAGTYGGFFPLSDNGTWEKNAAAVRQLHALRDRIRQLERTVQALKPEQP